MLSANEKLRLGMINKIIQIYWNSFEILNHEVLPDNDEIIPSSEILTQMPYIAFLELQKELN